MGCCRQECQTGMSARRHCRPPLLTDYACGKFAQPERELQLILDAPYATCRSERDRRARVAAGLAQGAMAVRTTKYLHCAKWLELPPSDCRHRGSCARNSGGIRSASERPFDTH